MTASEGGYIILLMGCMFSGKTDRLIKICKDSMSKGFKTMCFKPTVDTRWDKTEIISRSGKKMQAISISSAADIVEKVFSAITPTERLSIFIDEAQFIPKLATNVKTLAKMGVRVYIAGLSGDRDCEPWQSISELIPVVDEIEYLHAKCVFCGEIASFTLMLTPDRSSTDKIVIDDGTNYVATCRRCWEERHVSHS